MRVAAAFSYAPLVMASIQFVPVNGQYMKKEDCQSAYQMLITVAMKEKGKCDDVKTCYGPMLYYQDKNLCPTCGC